MLQVSNVSVRYGRKTAVDGVSFDVPEREIVGVIGPNGSGKSSLLSAIAGRVSPSAGSISVSGATLTAMPARRRAQLIGLLNQRNTAPGDLSVRDLVMYGRHPHRRWHERFSAQDAQIVDWALAHTQLESFAERQLTALSGGEAQRAWIAMALAQQPRLLLLDEPTTYLDISHQHDVLDLVASLGESLGITVVMVLHDLNQASTFCSRIVAMSGGRVVGDGTPVETLTADLVRDVYGMDAEISASDCGGPPRIYLQRRQSIGRS